MREMRTALLVQGFLMGTLLLFVWRIRYSFEASTLILILIPIGLLLRRMKRTWSDYSFIKRNSTESLWQNHHYDREPALCLIWSILILFMVVADSQGWASIHTMIFFIFLLDPMLNERNALIAVQEEGLYIKGIRFIWNQIENAQIEYYRKEAVFTIYVQGKDKNLSLKKQDVQAFLDATVPLLHVSVEDVSF